MYTQIVGDPNFPPTIQPCSDFGPNYVLDGFPNTNGSYWNGGNTPLNFYKSIRNVNVDTTKVDPSVNVKCLNWAVSQATSIKYMTFIMAENGLHQGVESQGSLAPTIKDNTGGSGTMFGDLTFKNGNTCLTISNQQFHFK
jgi:glucan 1,3-beta-glucosidase